MTQPSHSQRAVNYTRMSTDGQNCSIQLDILPTLKDGDSYGAAR